MADQRFTILDLTALAAAGVSNKDDVWIGVDDDQGVTPLSKKMSMTELESLIGGGGGGSGTANTLPATTHGFSASDVGKPLAYNSSGTLIIWDDATEVAFPFGVLASVTDSNNVVIARCGDVVTIADALLPAGVPNDSANGETNSRLLYWDKSAVKYQFTVPIDSTYPLEAVYYLKASATASYSYIISMLPRVPVTRLES
jgi:hypothetical protein